MLNDKKELYLTYMRSMKNSSEHTLRGYRLDLEHFFEFLRISSLEALDKWVIRKYLALLHEQGKKKRTISRKISCMRSFFTFLKRENLIAHNPMEEIEGPRLETLAPKILAPEHIEILFSQPDVQSYLGLRDRTMMELFYSSGLRLSELVALDRGDVYLLERLIKIKGKGKKERLIPLTPLAIKWVEIYLKDPRRHLDSEEHQAEKDEKAIFLNKWGKRITARSVDRNFERHLKSSGLAGKITPHTLRHTIATHLLERGMNLKIIQDLLGHNSPSTTTLYTRVSTRLKREVYEKTHPLVLEENKKTPSHFTAEE